MTEANAETEAPKAEAETPKSEGTDQTGSKSDDQTPETKAPEAKTSAARKTSNSRKPSRKKAGKGDRLVIQANVTGAYRRAGLNLSDRREVTIKASALSKARLAQLDADPRVTVRPAEA